MRQVWGSGWMYCLVLWILESVLGRPSVSFNGLYVRRKSPSAQAWLPGIQSSFVDVQGIFLDSNLKVKRPRRVRKLN